MYWTERKHLVFFEAIEVNVSFFVNVVLLKMGKIF